MNYGIDTSAILDASRRYYPPDVFPGLWRNLETLVANGRLRATEEVLLELEKRDDDAHRWAKQHRSMFDPLDAPIQHEVMRILSSHPKLIDTRANRSGADPFVIAHAKLQRLVLITGERPTGSAQRPHIPDVCAAYGVQCIDILQLVRNERWVF